MVLLLRETEYAPTKPYQYYQPLSKRHLLFSKCLFTSYVSISAYFYSRFFPSAGRYEHRAYGTAYERRNAVGYRNAVKAQRRHAAEHPCEKIPHKIRRYDRAAKRHHRVPCSGERSEHAEHDVFNYEAYREKAQIAYARFYDRLLIGEQRQHPLGA